MDKCSQTVYLAKNVKMRLTALAKHWGLTQQGVITMLINKAFEDYHSQAELDKVKGVEG